MPEKSELNKEILRKIINKALPYEIAGLPAIIAEPWLEIDHDTEHPGMEGPIFDRAGNFYVCRVCPPPGPEGAILKVTPDKKKSVFFRAGKTIPVGIAVHKDGRFFVACLTGEILVINPDGTLQKELRPAYKNESMEINDLVFDKKGNLYFTDFRGYANDPIGGVFRYDADGDYTKLSQIAGNLASPNGISMSPEGDVLWIGEAGRNAVLRIALTPDGKMVPFAGFSYVYYNTGDTAPDSNKVDSDGNLYQAIMPGGRIAVLSRHGIPIANIMVPGREEGRNLMTPNLVLKPGTDEGYMLAAGTEGSWIYRFTALAKAQELYSHS